MVEFSLKYEDDDWIKELAEEVDHTWSASGMALLLAKVPVRLQERSIDLQDRLGARRLKSVLEEHRDRFRLVRDPDNELVWGVLPSHVSAAPTPELFRTRKATDREARELGKPVPQFMRGFWTAFVKRIPEGRERYLDISSTPYFEDVPKGQFAPPHLVRVDDIYILSEGDLLSEAPDPELVYKKIQDWCKQYGVDERRFYVRSYRDGSKASKADFAERLSQLSDKDLSRIMVPGDIVLKLLKE